MSDEQKKIPGRRIPGRASAPPPAPASAWAGRATGCRRRPCWSSNSPTPAPATPSTARRISTGWPRISAPLQTLRVHSAAPDRLTYLRRPDLGRQLDAASVERLASHPAAGGDWDLLFVIADGLSAAAVQVNAAPLVHACHERLFGWRIGPVVLAEQARVALGDGVAAALGARLLVLLVGERPGLSAAESLGAYLTWDAKPGRADSERNCISNIHADGLPIGAAADKLCWLANEAARLKLTGVSLKEDAPSLPGPGNDSKKQAPDLIENA